MCYCLIQGKYLIFQFNGSHVYLFYIIFGKIIENEARFFFKFRCPSEIVITNDISYERRRQQQQRQRKKLLSTQKWNATLFIFFRIANRVNDTKKANVSFRENVPSSNVKRSKIADAKRMSLIGQYFFCTVC